MVKRKRLGKGLEDISHYFISPDPKKDQKEEEPGSQIVEDESRCRVVSIVDLFDPRRGAILTLKIGLELCKNDVRTLVIDADTRFPSIAFMLGLSIPGISFRHYAQEKYQPSDLILTGPSGLKLLAPRLSMIDPSEIKMPHFSPMLKALISVEKEIDIIILRQYRERITSLTGKGIFIIPSHHTGMIRAYRELKAFISGGGKMETGIVITGVTDELTARKVYEKIAGCTGVYYGMRPHFYGYLSDDASSHSANISSLISNICKIGPGSDSGIKKERSFFEGLRYSIGEDDLTGEEITRLREP